MTRLATALLFTLAAGFASAQAAFEEGKHYFLLNPPQPSLAAPGKIEVTEVFSYGCPACFQFESYMKTLEKALPPTAELHRVPASFRPDENWPLFQRAFLAAQALGIQQKSHDAMYQAVWGGGSLKAQSVTLDAIAKFYAGYGVTAEDFLKMANSFGTNAKMKQADNYLRTHWVDSTPTLIVGGKYRLTPATAGGAQQTVDVVLFLVQKESGG